MAELSDQLLVVAILAYLVAMVCHAVEYAFGQRGAVSRAVARPERQLVGAAVGGDPAKPPKPVDEVPSGPARAPGRVARSVLAGRVAVALTGLGAVVHLGSLVTRGVAAERIPFGNMYEYLLALTFVGVAVWLGVLARRSALRHLGLYVTLVMVLLLGLAGTVIYTPVGPLQPALRSYWFVIHISAAVLSSGILLFGFVPAALYLLRSGWEQGRRGFPYDLARGLPDAGVLERFAFRIHAFAFPIWTFAIVGGAIWAEAAWGRYWGWDPKETWAFISWVVYAGYLHARATPSVRRSTATWIAVLGFLTMLMNLFGVNLFFDNSLHSYAEVD
ncbi:MAG TPA: c-type cytochrome biogenesis protein CcsB [Micromonosporaceae bacterium]